jgi:hypothetical protein
MMRRPHDESRRNPLREYRASIFSIRIAFRQCSLPVSMTRTRWPLSNNNIFDFIYQLTCILIVNVEIHLRELTERALFHDSPNEEYTYVYCIYSSPICIVCKAIRISMCHKIPLLPILNIQYIENRHEFFNVYATTITAFARGHG